MKSAPTIAFDYRPSRWIGAFAVLIVASATLAPWLSGLPLPLQLVLSLAALVIGVAALRRHWYPRIRRIAWQASGWLLLDTSDAEIPALLESHTHLGVLLALAFRYGPRERFRPVLAPDNLDTDTRRRLVVLLARADIAHGH